MNLARILAIAEHGVALDTETHLVQRGLLAPPLVVGSVALLDLDAYTALELAGLRESEGRHAEAARIREKYDGRPALPGELLAKDATLELFLRLLEDPNAIIVGANIAFDLLVLAIEWAKRGRDVLPLIFRAFSQGRIYDLQIAEALHAIAGGHLGMDPRTGRPLVTPGTKKRGLYSLAICTDLVLGRSDAKANDEYRLRYAELEPIPIAEWPESARTYPVDDARNTIETALGQCGHVVKTIPHHEWGPAGCIACGTNRFGEPCLAKQRHRNLHDHANQVWTAFCLHLGAAWGFRVDQSKVDVIEQYAVRKRAAGIAPFQSAGVIRPEGSVCEAEVKQRVARAYGSQEPCPHCAGTGKVLAPNPRLLQCPTCRGRCVSWKAGGKIKEPTVARCEACGNTGKVVDLRHRVTCAGTAGEKTCDGTGLKLEYTVPRSDTGCVSIGADTLHESGDEFLMSYGAFGEDAKFLQDYVPYLREARRELAGGGWLDVPLTLKPVSERPRLWEQRPDRASCVMVAAGDAIG